MVRRDDKIALDRYIDKLTHIKKYNNVDVHESDIKKKQRIERGKRDYPFMVQYYFPHYADCECGQFQIDAANEVKANKDLMSVEEWARAHAKSTHFDIFIPFWLWINNDLNVGLFVGKSEEDAKTLLSDLQAEFEANPQIIADFGEQISSGDWQAGNFVTKNGKAFFSLGRGQSPRGVRYRQHRPDYIVCDDIDDDVMVKNPRRVKETVNWILEALFNTMDNKGARFILVNNRIGVNTVLTNLINRPGVKHRIVNALDAKGNPTWHQKYTKAYFEERRRIIGEYAFQKEFMNNPQVEGEIFKDEQIQWCPLPALDSFQCIVGHWDIAYAGSAISDFNAVKIWGLKDSRFYHIKAFVRRCKMGEAIRWMMDFDKTMPENIRIHWRFESQFWNDAMRMVLSEAEKERNQTLALIQCDRPVTNKFDRIVGLQPYFQNHRVFFNEAERYDNGMQTGIGQLKAIEPGYKTNDDGPDADEGAISYLAKQISINNPLPLLGMRSSSKGHW